jgi:plasmid stability protein
MAQLIVRNVETSVKNRLQRRAKQNGHSMEEEVREILRDATKQETPATQNLGTAISMLFRHAGLKPKESIRELHTIEIHPPDFTE